MACSHKPVLWPISDFQGGLAGKPSLRSSRGTFPMTHALEILTYHLRASPPTPFRHKPLLFVGYRIFFRCLGDMEQLRTTGLNDFQLKEGAIVSLTVPECHVFKERFAADSRTPVTCWALASTVPGLNAVRTTRPVPCPRHLLRAVVCVLAFPALEPNPQGHCQFKWLEHAAASHHPSLS